jgi:RNA-directed DNA polymerase
VVVFFDRVNHDRLMGLVAKRVCDKRVLRLIRGLLTAGVLADGLVGPTDEGTPQSLPLRRQGAAPSRRCCRT